MSGLTLGISIYTDEMVYTRFAAALRMRGYEALGCAETTPKNRGIPDSDQLAYATMSGRAILTEDVSDYIALDAAWKMRGRVHAGIIVFAGIGTFGELLRRTMLHLDVTDPVTQRNTLLWLT